MSFLEVAAAIAVALGLANTIAIVLLVRAASRDVELETMQGLPLGAAVPSFELTAVDGSRVTEKAVHGQVLVFLGATCRPCHTVARELATAPSELLQKLIVLVTGDTARLGDNIFELLSFMPPDRVTHDPQREVALRLAMPGTPFLYAIDGSGRVQAKSVKVTTTGLERMLTKVSARA